jgi:hypothetical protein
VSRAVADRAINQFRRSNPNPPAYVPFVFFVFNIGSRYFGIPSVDTDTFLRVLRIFATNFLNPD